MVHETSLTHRWHFRVVYGTPLPKNAILFQTYYVCAVLASYRLNHYTRTHLIQYSGNHSAQYESENNDYVVNDSTTLNSSLGIWSGSEVQLNMCSMVSTNWMSEKLGLSQNFLTSVRMGYSWYPITNGPGTVFTTFKPPATMFLLPAICILPTAKFVIMQCFSVMCSLTCRECTNFQPCTSSKIHRLLLVITGLRTIIDSRVLLFIL